MTAAIVGSRCVQTAHLNSLYFPSRFKRSGPTGAICGPLLGAMWLAGNTVDCDYPAWLQLFVFDLKNCMTLSQPFHFVLVSIFSSEELRRNDKVTSKIPPNSVAESLQFYSQREQIWVLVLSLILTYQLISCVSLVSYVMSLRPDSGYC